MASPVPDSPHVRFGPFELDPSAGRLFKEGIPLKLQPQPFRVLLLLTSRPGQVVTREEIRRRLWGDSTFVDFEGGINFSVNRIRALLCENAEKPRYIETIPRVGYRFIGSLEPSNGNGVGSAVSVETTSLRVVTRSSEKAAPGASKFHWKQSLLYGFPMAITLATLLGWWGVDRWKASRKLSNEPIRSLAVLPLENLSGDPSQDYFADAVTDQLITDLGRSGQLRVISRTSVMRYKKTDKTLPEIARELNVDAIVEGSVTRSEDDVRITAQLIQASTDVHLWADSYKGNLRDVLGLQENVAGAIADRVASRLATTRQLVPASSRTVSPAAYEDYLRGFAQPTTIDGTQASIDYFESAIRQQPDYAEAYSGLARSYTWLGHMLALPPGESFTKAKSIAERAIALDDRIVDAHSILGQIHLLYDWDFAAAEKELRRAMELNPNSVGARSRYAEALAASGRYHEAMEEIYRTQQTDPMAVNAASVAGFLYWSHQYDEAIAAAQKTIATNPNSYNGHLFLGLSLEQKRQFSGALPELRKAVELSNDKMWNGFVAHDLALSGNKVEARRILREMEGTSKHTYVSPWWLAMVNTGLGDKERAFYWLEKAYQGREHDLIFMNCWPMFDPLRNDPRFEDLERRIGLSQ
jgi:TolB-like protein/DNA-binding winged helix-turn-helix (wHTH) protein/tetratricopeptide (TPR) repeat protein